MAKGARKPYILAANYRNGRSARAPAVERLILDEISGLVSPASFVASPNCDARPGDACIELLVVHCISLPPGEYGGPYIEQLFCNCLDPSNHEYFLKVSHLCVSSHFLIRRDGTLIQFVPTHMRAWHAGQSSFRGRSNVNDFSLGIELEGTDDSPFTDAQYDALTQLTNTLMLVYPRIDVAGLVGHSDIAPGRKTDPGRCFDWCRYLRAFAGS